MKNILYTIILSFLFSFSVFADLDAVEDAYRAGDYVTFFKELKTLAEQGDALAQHNLGYIYSIGQVVTQNYKEAVKWFRLAAKQGNTNSQHNLGLMYENGYGVTQDFKEAVKWFRLAAKQGDAPAQNDLGFMYLHGRGVVKNYVLADMWFNVATSSGLKQGKKNRDDTERRMTPKQIAEARKLARECVKKNYKDCG